VGWRCTERPGVDSEQLLRKTFDAAPFPEYHSVSWWVPPSKRDLSYNENFAPVKGEVMQKFVFALLVCAGPVCVAVAQPDVHSKAASELYEVMSLRETFLSGFAAAFRPQLEQLAKRGVENTKLKRIEKAALVFAEKIADDPEFEKRMVAIYVKAFTKKEIRELIDFYRTPTGQKAIRKFPELFQQGARVGRELALKHQSQFQKDVQAILADDAVNGADKRDANDGR